MIGRRRTATRYANRTVAGRTLADALVTEAVVEKPVVLALPRGGVPVAGQTGMSTVLGEGTHGASEEKFLMRQGAAPM